VNVNLIRFAYLPDVTLGWMYAGSLKLATLEEGWAKDPDGPGGQRREGALRESCIPDGLYDLRPHFSQRYPAGVWAMSNTNLGVWPPGQRPSGQKWGRDAVLIHSGNDTDDIEGCIVVGFRHDMEPGRHVVRESRNALEKLRTGLGTTLAHTIRIRPSAGTNEVL
jgi:hypothetical protein